MPVLETKYVYKVYRGDTYVTDLDNVVSLFQFAQEINTPGAQLTIKIANKFDDVGAVQTDTFWVDESGNRIVDENGNRIVFDTTLNFNNIPIDLANRVKVYKFNSYYPNGTLVFDGLISKWGTSYKENQITLTVLSYGVQLANYFVSSATAGFTIDQQVQNTTHAIIAEKGQNDQYAQTFTIVSDTLVGGFNVYSYAGVAGTISTLYWYLYSGTPSSPGSLIDSGSIQAQDTAGLQSINLTTPTTLMAGTYYLHLNGGLGGGSYSQPVLGSTTTAPYAGGQLFYRDQSSTSTWTGLSEDLTFTVNTSDGGATLSFNSIDPGTIARTFMAQMIAQGSKASYTNSTIELTNTTATYDFKVASGLDGIQKSLSLAPDGWYWYYDIPTNLVHFHQNSQTADHKFVLGKHFFDANVEYSLETVKNSVYFSGGDNGSGQNLFSIYTSASSIATYGKWSELLSDNRVTLQETADTIGTSELNAKQSPLFQIQIEISDKDYDTETIRPGQMVQFRNFNNLLDTIYFQIVRREPHGDSVILVLGNLPPRQPNELQLAKKRLEALETINNTSTPT